MTPIAVNGVSLNQNTATMSKGDTLQLKATVSPENATNKALTWSVNNELCEVSSNGLVECKSSSSGTSVVTVSTADGNYTDTCTIEIQENLEKVLLVDTTVLTNSELNFTKSEGVVPSALFFNFDSTNKTTDLSGKTLASIEFHSTPGTFTYGKVDLTKFGTDNLTLINPQTVTINEDDIVDGYAIIDLNELHLGSNETLGIHATTDTATAKFAVNYTSNNYILNTASLFKSGTYNQISFKCKIYSYQ